MEFFKNLNIKFMKIKFIAMSISLLVIASCIGYVVMNGFNMGIDFVGGHLIHLKFNEMPDIDEMRNRLAAAGYPTAVLQADIEHGEVMIRVQREDVIAGETEVETTQMEQQTVQKVITALMSTEDKSRREEGLLDLNLAGKAQLVDLLVAEDPLKYLETQPTAMTAEEFARREYMKLAEHLIDEYRDRMEGEGKRSGIITNFDAALDSLDTPRNREELLQIMRSQTFVGNFSRIRTEMVSATVGSELADAALSSILFSLAGILAYIWFRFNNRFSVAAIIALIHDVIITMGIFTIAGREFNLPIVAAILTIVGYSLNDTIVIFVRIRENLTVKRKEAKENFEGLLNSSINQTLSRTLLTSGTTLIVVLFLFFMGGTVINDFAFTLFIGVIVGTYSSIFVASPVLAIWQSITGTGGGAVPKVKTARA
jgi:preprotein translocase subunit SecF